MAQVTPADPRHENLSAMQPGARFRRWVRYVLDKYPNAPTEYARGGMTLTRLHHDIENAVLNRDPVAARATRKERDAALSEAVPALPGGTTQPRP